MATTTRNGFRYPTSTSVPNVPQDIQNLAMDLEAKGQYRGSVSIFPTNAINGDWVYHTTYLCYMVYRGSAVYWRQMTVPEVSNLATYTASLTSASLQMHNGFQVFDPATNRWWTCITSATAEMQYTGGGTPPLTNPAIVGFTNVAGSPVGYYKDGSGVVHLEGSMTNTNGFVQPSATIFTLPAGYRPGPTVPFSISTNGAPSAAVSVSPAGAVIISLTGYGSGTAAAGLRWDLNGVHFRAVN